MPLSRELRRLREQVQQGPADVQIGKKGLTDAVLREIDRRLRDKGVIKVRVHKSALKVTGLDRRELARVVAEKLNAMLLDVRGRTFVLYRPGEAIKAGSEGRREGVSRGNRAGGPRRPADREARAGATQDATS